MAGKNSKKSGREKNAAKTNGNSPKKKTDLMKGPAVPEGWFLFSGKEAGITDVRAALPDGIESDIWKEAGVLEVLFGEEGSMDIEVMDVENEDEKAFMEEQNAKSLFYISCPKALYEKALPVMKALVMALDGKILGDTPDMEPEIH